MAACLLLYKSYSSLVKNLTFKWQHVWSISITFFPNSNSYYTNLLDFEINVLFSFEREDNYTSVADKRPSSNFFLQKK